MTNDKFEEKITETYFSDFYYKKFYTENTTLMNDSKILDSVIKKLDEIILEMCNHYLLLTGINIENLSPNLFEFIEQILRDGKKNLYQKKFLICFKLFANGIFFFNVKRKSVIYDRLVTRR